MAVHKLEIVLTSVQEYLETSSSSDDELLCILEKIEKPRMLNYIEGVVYKYTDEQFRSTFRIKRPTANQLIEINQRHLGEYKRNYICTRINMLHMCI